MERMESAFHSVSLPVPLFDLGQHVRVKRGPYRGLSGRIVSCSYEYDAAAWKFYLTVSGEKLGPFEGTDLW